MSFSISEVIVVVLIALLVIKPEQLPEVAFTVGRFAKSIKRMFGKVKEEMNGLVEAVEKPDEQKREQQ